METSLFLTENFYYGDGLEYLQFREKLASYRFSSVL